MLLKTTRINYLFDFYQELLTPKQKNYMEMYYLEDYSLGEIADEFQVSRQAVYDNIRRTELMLEEYETKLHLYEKFEKRQTIISQVKEKLDEVDEDDIYTTELFDLIKQLENLD